MRMRRIVVFCKKPFGNRIAVRPGWVRRARRHTQSTLPGTQAGGRRRPNPTAAINPMVWGGGGLVIT